MTKTIRSIVLFFLLASICLSALTVTVYATPQSHPNTHVNTGDQRADIVAVALTQVGYYEGANNDTKYGVWYGYNNLGWCGIFVAWCANQAAVPTSVLARTGLADPSAFGLTVKPEGYIPLSGDLFFSRDHSHVGLVYYVEGDHFYSLEGNTWENGPEGVYIRKHKLSNVIFASPNYQGGGNHSYVLGSDTEHPHREFYKCSDCGDRYYTGKTVSPSDCTICVQSNCSHSYSRYSKQSETQHSRICTKCGKEEVSDHSWDAGKVTKPASCSSSGSKAQTCTSCGASRSVVIPKSGMHSFGAYISVDNAWHNRICGICGVEEKMAHELLDIEADEHTHWQRCKICEHIIDSQAHRFGDKCDSPCQICEYSRPDGHQYQDQWMFDEETHWHACAVCGQQKDMGLHDYNAECDETCDTCGYTRTTDHSFRTAWTTDEKMHWYQCDVCGQAKDIQAHTPEEVNRQGAMIHCTVCNRILTEESEHTHGFDVVYSDPTGHWGSCSCGVDMEAQSHQWSFKTERCSICQRAMPKMNAEDSVLILWIAGAAAFLLFGIVLIIILLRKKK